MFLENKYTQWYFDIIEKSKICEKFDYYEKHHIIPKSLGGSNDQSNIVSLTAREHYICHLLLTKMVNGVNKTKMTYAFWIISNRFNQTSSKVYEALRIEFSVMVKNRKHTEESKIKMSKAQSGKIILDKQRQRLREVNTGLVRTFSDEHKRNLSKAGRGRVITSEWRQKLSNANKGQGKGRKLSEETKRKLSERAKERAKAKLTANTLS